MTRVVLVAGATGSIGEAICIKLSALGYQVVALGSFRQNEKENWIAAMEDAGCELPAYPCDSADDAIQTCIAKIETDIGVVDVLINNLGDRLFQPTSKNDREAKQFSKMTSIDLAGLLHERMVKRGWGRIINIASANPNSVFAQNHNPLRKIGIHGFSKAAVFQLSQNGVTVNIITPINKKSMTAKLKKEQPKERGPKKDISKSTTEKLDKPEEVAGLVAYLISDEAAFLTGADIAINGSQTTS